MITKPVNGVGGTTTLNISLGNIAGVVTVNLRISDAISRAIFKVHYNGNVVYDSITATRAPISFTINKLNIIKEYVTIEVQGDTIDTYWESVVTCPK